MLNKTSFVFLTTFFLCAFSSAFTWAEDFERDTKAIDQITTDVTETHNQAGAYDKLEGLENFFDGMMGTYVDQNDIGGAVISIVKDGDIILSKGYGYADAARTRPVDPATTLFRPGSIGKTITWTAVMQLVEQGKLDLDTDVNEYLTTFQIPDTYAEPITLRHLMTHTPGFEAGISGYFRSSESELIGIEAWLKKMIPARVRAPGKISSYSNYGTVLAGLIVANVSGLDFDSYIEQHIFNPLGMTRSTFREPLPDSFAADMSDGFVIKEGSLEKGPFEYIHDVSPAGGMSSTALDMAKFMIAHLGDGTYQNGRILNEKTIRQMREPLFTIHKDFPKVLHGFFEHPNTDHKLYYHTGGTSYFFSNMVLMPEENLGLFISFNSPAGGGPSNQIPNVFLNKYFPKTADAPPSSEDKTGVQDKSADELTSKTYGAYRLTRRSYSKWEKAGALLAGDVHVRPSSKEGIVISSPIIGGDIRMVPVGDGVFQNVDNSHSKFAFQQNAAGEVTYILTAGPIAFKKIGVFEQASTHQIILGMSFLLFLGILFSGVTSFQKWLAMSHGEKIGKGAVFLGAMFYVIFVALLTMHVSSNAENVAQGLDNILSLSIIALLFTVLSTVMLVPAWSHGYWSILGRVKYGVCVLFLILFTLILNYWNLLGPWYVNG